jgi:hypothetical protein
MLNKTSQFLSHNDIEINESMTGLNINPNESFGKKSSNENQASSMPKSETLNSMNSSESSQNYFQSINNENRMLPNNYNRD